MSTLSNKELYVLSSNTYSNMLNITKSKNIYDCIYDTDIDNTAAVYSFCKFYNTKEILLCNEEFMEEHQTRIKFIQSFNSMKKEQQSNMILLDVVFRNIIELFYGLLKRCGYNILFQYGIHSNNLQTVIKNSNAYRDTMDGNKLLMTKEDIIETAECYKIPLVYFCVMCVMCVLLCFVVCLQYFFEFLIQLCYFFIRQFHIIWKAPKHDVMKTRSKEPHFIISHIIIIHMLTETTQVIPSVT
jgi:hypothetical protein